MKCLACGCEYWSVVGPNRFFPGSEIVRCMACGTIQPDPVPSPGAVSEFYCDGYYRYSPVATQIKKRLGDLYARSRKFWIEQYVPLKSGARVLEIGCGYGNLLNLLSRAVDTWSFGIEPSREAVSNRCDGKFLIEHESFERAELKYAHPEFDLIVMSHVLEHLVDPSVAIEKLKSMLAPGGWLYLEVPNRHAPTYRKNNYQNVPDFYFFDRFSFDLFLTKHGLAGQVFNMEVAHLTGRYDKIGCVVNWPLHEAMQFTKQPILYRGGSDSFAICAIVRAK